MEAQRVSQRMGSGSQAAAGPTPPHALCPSAAPLHTPPDTRHTAVCDPHTAPLTTHPLTQQPHTRVPGAGDPLELSAG